LTKSIQARVTEKLYEIAALYRDAAGKAFTSTDPGMDEVAETLRDLSRVYDKLAAGEEPATKSKPAVKIPDHHTTSGFSAR
jgi:hypothetical protein